MNTSLVTISLTDRHNVQIWTLVRNRTHLYRLKSHSPVRIEIALTCTDWNLTHLYGLKSHSPVRIEIALTSIELKSHSPVRIEITLTSTDWNLTHLYGFWLQMVTAGNSNVELYVTMILM